MILHTVFSLALLAQNGQCVTHTAGSQHVAFGYSATVTDTRSVMIGYPGGSSTTPVAWYSAATYEEPATQTTTGLLLGVFVFALCWWVSNSLITGVLWQERRTRLAARAFLVNLFFGWLGVTFLLFLPWGKYMRQLRQTVEDVFEDAAPRQEHADDTVGSLSMTEATGGEISCIPTKVHMFSTSVGTKGGTRAIQQK